MMELEPKPDESKSTSQTAGTSENLQIPTPPSEEDPTGHRTESASEEPTAGGSGKADQNANGTGTENGEGPPDAGDDASDAGITPPQYDVNRDMPRPLPPNEYPYIVRPMLPPIGSEIRFGEPSDLINTTVSRRQELKAKHDEYILLLEDRVTRLENNLTKFLAKPVKPPIAPSKFMFVPELRELSWKDWVDSIGKSANEGHSTIEILVDLPTSRGRENPSEQGCQENDLRGPEQQQGLRGVQRRASRLPEDVVDLPERMRINTGILLNILDRDIMDKGAINSMPTQVLRRPYKALVYYKDAILGHLDGLKSKLEPEAIERVQKQLDAPEERDLPMNSEADSEFHYLLLSLVGDFVKNWLEPVITRVPNQSRIQFHELWFLFQPGQHVYVKDKEIPQPIWRVLQTMGGNRYLHKPGRDSRRGPGGRRARSLSYSPSRSRTPPRVRGRGISPRTVIVDDLGSSRFPVNEFSPFLIDCYCIDYDGYQFRPVYRRFEIQKFEDNVAIKTLNIMPLEKAEEADLIRKEDRRKIGEQYLECIKATHRLFDGRTLDRNCDGDVLYLQKSEEWRNERRAFPENLEGKVMVDLTTAVQANPDWRPEYNELVDYMTPNDELQSDSARRGGYAEYITDDYIIDLRRREDFWDKEELKCKAWNSDPASKPEGDDLMLLPDRVYAFVLRTRRWACLPLGFDEKGEPLLKQVAPEDDAWNDLQLPGGDDGHKHIIQSLIEKHFAKDMAIDLVRDKGRGLIILLHGAPGVGKTSTAECVAAANGKPLLPITCGDLGLSPKEVEENLEFHFRLAQSWDCVLLLDEADVFLARRTVQDVNRNALVSVFLRILEYYEGILFLTTNRVGTLDEAFRSRIHMSLYYPTLSADQTAAIWKILCRRAVKQQERLDIDEEAILEYALEHFNSLQKPSGSGSGATVINTGWNGRQIKNAFMSAIALAHYGVPPAERVKLKIGHFKKVAKASKEFDDYLTRTHAGVDTATFALHQNIRADDFPINPGDDNDAGSAHYGAVPPRKLFRQNPTAQPQFQNQNAYGMMMNPFMQGMAQGGFPQPMGMQMPQQQFYGQVPAQGMGVQIPQQPQQQQQFYPPGQQTQNMGSQQGMQNMANQQPQMGGNPMGNQVGGQATAGAQQTNPQQPQQGQQNFGAGFVQGQGGFMGQS